MIFKKQMLALTLCACERFSLASGELNRSTVVKEILITAQSGGRGTSDEKIRYYNLDAIISIGYRVNSIRATTYLFFTKDRVLGTISLGPRALH